MNYAKLNGIEKAYFGYEEIGKVLGLTPGSAKVSANRYVKQGLLVRVKRNLYVLKERWNACPTEERFTLANLIQVPSYISLLTALSYYKITTQIKRDFIESVAVKRTKQVERKGTTFSFTRIDEKLYSGFSRERGFFIASAEKAFLDAFYLMSIKRYSLDLASIDFWKLDKGRLRAMAGAYPERTRKDLAKYGYITKT